MLRMAVLVGDLPDEKLAESLTADGAAWGDAAGRLVGAAECLEGAAAMMRYADVCARPCIGGGHNKS